ncbi:MAG TPA: Spy/CpxP family protein refolding chaperone [Phycisphaerae bacterium]|jgi:Spy/CpxP family protein refolding chaperone|nr:periplasmic heavy metal sensor [Phycisphaerae bacterium]HOB75713.1 Spy/CpxP family protein refolding chaperone [Phycisphaerae bacterium]HOJ56438.1 Spy/CpxP family protein refolding chaperone [Phycisphaerae bacterium]HOL28001.1 Spy/CpxP family protein refolding chaperone [Phycisphaerae bacterium]HPP22412.1 Spy/CpxP family protein refolding chaperone [Phycisphaerae bacterium]
MTKALVVVCFVAAFAAGLVVGLQWRAPEPPQTKRPSRGGGWLARELDLTPSQQEELDKIWSQIARSGGREREERRRQLYRERDEAIVALIRPEDELLYEAILSDYAAQMAELDAEWRTAFDDAVERTRQILTPDQQARCDQLLQRLHRERGPYDWRRGERDRGVRPGPRGGPPGSRGSPSGPASRPQPRADGQGTQRQRPTGQDVVVNADL